jgi:hypothetical protein
VVIIKGNYQWEGRNTTSTDRIKGLIWRILNHPEGFTGEIMMCDNTQDIGTGIGHTDNNSEDPAQSIVNVIRTFKGKGYPVRFWDWNSIFDVVADEYSAGDYSDGYVYDPLSKVTYPKFKSKVNGEYVSLAHGVWDSLSASYDSSRLTIIDFPVLKAHMWNGATVALKNWIGVMTIAYATERYGGFNAMHNSYLFGAYALTARILAETWPDLTIVDAAWTATHDQYSPLGFVNTDMLLASTDPAAVSWYAAKHILTPIADYPEETDPDRPGSDYNTNLNHWTGWLQAAGFPVTIDSAEISVYDREVLVTTSVDGAVPAAAPRLVLHPNAPNPFNPRTSISFDLGAPGRVELSVYDVTGKLVRGLIRGEERSAGRHAVLWDGTDDRGRPVASGAYFSRLRSGGQERRGKLLLLR